MVVLVDTGRYMLPLGCSRLHVPVDYHTIPVVVVGGPCLASHGIGRNDRQGRGVIVDPSLSSNFCAQTWERHDV